MHNFNHDIIQTLSVKLDSLWRYDEYLKNAKGCEVCENMWKELKEADLKAAKKLRDEIARHIDQNKFESCDECFIGNSPKNHTGHKNS